MFRNPFDGVVRQMTFDQIRAQSAGIKAQDSIQQPAVVEACQGPLVTYTKTEIEPKDIKKGISVVMVVEEGPKGKAAKSWCFRKTAFEAELEVATMPMYRLLARRIVQGEPYSDPVNHCWVTDQWLACDWVWEGYRYQLDDFQHQTGWEYQAYSNVDGGWEKCKCPLRRYNGGPLFDLPYGWNRTVK